MFHTLLARLALKRAKWKEIIEASSTPHFATPLSVHNHLGEYKDHYGKLGLDGFYFETTEVYMIGELVRIKVVLLGLGIEVETSGTVTRILPANGHVGVIACFDSMEFETERVIARWLDMMQKATQQPAG